MSKSTLRWPIQTALIARNLPPQILVRACTIAFGNHDHQGTYRGSSPNRTTSAGASFFDYDLYSKLAGRGFNQRRLVDRILRIDRVLTNERARP